MPRSLDNQRNHELEPEYDPDTTPAQNPEPDCKSPVRRQPRQAAALTARDRLIAQALDADEDMILVDHRHGQWGE